MASFGNKNDGAAQRKKYIARRSGQAVKNFDLCYRRYERKEMTPSIEMAKKIAGFLNTTVGYLLGETKETNIHKDPEMLQRLHDLKSLKQEEQSHILFALDAMLGDAKTRSAHAK